MSDMALDTASEINVFVASHPDTGCTWHGQRIERCVGCPLPRCPRARNQPTPEFTPPPRAQTAR